jgi:hypothetical protein
MPSFRPSPQPLPPEGGRFLPRSVQKFSPLLGVEYKVEVLEWSKPSHREPEARRQPSGRPAVDQESGAVVQDGGSETGDVIPIFESPHLHAANLPATTAAPDVTGDDARLGRWI